MTQPSLTVIGRPEFCDSHGDFLAKAGLSWSASEDATPAERLIEFSGRICYMSFDPNPRTRLSTKEYVQKLIGQGHESVLEHAQWTFILDGVTRGFSHQLVRHRVGFAFSQLSQQYHDETDADFIEPELLAQAPGLREKWKAIEASIQAFYHEAVTSDLAGDELDKREKVRWTRSFARSLLPNATRTVLSVSANARALRHFLMVRGAIEGDIEMRKVSSLFYEMLRAEAPAIVEDFDMKTMIDGSPIIIHEG